jgi:hypothetical protein
MEIIFFRSEKCKKNSFERKGKKKEKKACANIQTQVHVI